MDGTLLSSNVIETYLWLRLRELSGTERFAELSRIAAKVPSLVQAERRERSAFLRSVYREYDGARLSDLDAIADEHLTDHVLTRLSPAAVRKIREHRAAGHRTVLITGAIRPLTRPLIPLFDHIEAAELAVDDRGRVHRLPRLVAAGGGVAGRLDAAVRRRQRHRPRVVVRLRRLALRPAAARGGGPPGRRTARRAALPARAEGAVDDRRLGRARPPTPAPSTRQVVAR